MEANNREKPTGKEQPVEQRSEIPLMLENTARGNEVPVALAEEEENSQEIERIPSASNEPSCLCQKKWEPCRFLTITRADLIAIFVLIIVWLFIVLIATVTYLC